MPFRSIGLAPSSALNFWSVQAENWAAAEVTKTGQREREATINTESTDRASDNPYPYLSAPPYHSAIMSRLFLILLLGLGVVKVQGAYSIEWLKSGCVGFSKYDSGNSKQLTEQETEDAVNLGIWLQGYLQAVEMLSDSRGSSSIKKVPAGWSTSIAASKSLLAYLNEFEQKHKMKFRDAFEAKAFVSLWYDVKHPETEPIRAYMYERLFLKFFPDAFDAKHKSGKGQTVQIEINERKIVIPVPAGLVRIDGRLKSLDDAVAQMAAPMNNRVYAVFGTLDDSAMIDEGKFPTLSRSVTVQHNENLPKTISRDDFARLSRRLLPKLPKVDRTLSERFERIADAASSAMTDVSGLKSIMKLGETKSLGIFASGENFLCHSLLIPLKASVEAEALSMIQATSVAAIRTEEQVVSVYANALFEGPDDLLWTRGVCKAAVAYITDSDAHKK